MGSVSVSSTMAIFKHWKHVLHNCPCLIHNSFSAAVLADWEPELFPDNGFKVCRLDFSGVTFALAIFWITRTTPVSLFMLTSSVHVANGVWQKKFWMQLVLWFHNMYINLPFSLCVSACTGLWPPSTVTSQPQFWLIELRYDFRGSLLSTVEHHCSSLLQRLWSKKIDNGYICKYSSAVKPSLFLSLLTMQSSLLSVEIFIIFSSQILCFFNVKRPGNSTSASSLLQSEVRQMHRKIYIKCLSIRVEDFVDMNTLTCAHWKNAACFTCLSAWVFNFAGTNYEILGPPFLFRPHQNSSLVEVMVLYALANTDWGIGLGRNK